MDQPVTSELIEAINIYKERHGISDYKFSQLVNTTPTSFSRWMKFQTEYIKSKYASILMPMIQDIYDELLEKKKNQEPVVVPTYLKNVIQKLETLKNKDPQLLKSFCTMLDASFSFAQNAIPEKTGDSILELAKLPIKKLSLEARKEKSKKVKEELYYQPLRYEKEEVKVAAGNGCIYDYEYSVPSIGNRKDINVVKVEGESMAPFVEHGSRVVIQRFMEPLSFAELYLPLKAAKTLIPNGSIVIYNLNESGLAIKKVRYESYGEDKTPQWSLFLEALNDSWGRENNFPRRITMKDHLLIYGKMVGTAE